MNNTMETVYAVCTKVRNNPSNHGISFQSLLAKIRKEFRVRHIYLNLKSHRKITLVPEEFYVNAYYDPENDKDCEIPFEVIIFHNFNKEVIWDRSHISNLLIQIFDAVVHEFRHQTQSRKKHYKCYWEHSSAIDRYLSDPDEIDAYALSIVIELCRSMGKHRALNHLHRVSSMSKYRIQHNLVSPNLYAYFKIFKDLNHPVLKKLIKKIYIRLVKIDTDYIFV